MMDFNCLVLACALTANTGRSGDLPEGVWR